MCFLVAFTTIIPIGVLLCKWQPKLIGPTGYYLKWFQGPTYRQIDPARTVVCCSCVMSWCRGGNWRWNSPKNGQIQREILFQSRGISGKIICRWWLFQDLQDILFRTVHFFVPHRSASRELWWRHQDGNFWSAGEVQSLKKLDFNNIRTVSSWWSMCSRGQGFALPWWSHWHWEIP